LNPVRGREQAGRRPVVILSHDVFNERSGTVIALALTNQQPPARFPLTLELTAPNLPNDPGSRSARFERFRLTASGGDWVGRHPRKSRPFLKDSAK